MSKDPKSSASASGSENGEAPVIITIEHDVIDAANAWEVKPSIMDVILRGNRHVRINLANVTFIDSTGLGMLVNVLREAREVGGSVMLIHVRPDVQRVIRVTGLDTFFGLQKEE